MTIKRFLAPNLIAITILGLLWFSGIDSIFTNKLDPDKDRRNLQKYIQVQRTIMDNYVQTLDVASLYRHSLVGFVKGLSDSTYVLYGTPLDTVALPQIGSVRDAFMNFEMAYRYVQEMIPGQNMTELTDKAIIGMFAALDPHSNYVKRDDTEQFQEEMSAKFQGIGVSFAIISDTISIINAVPGGPSERLGIQSGDKIIAINDEPAIGFNNDQVFKRLRGPKDTQVKVTILRPGASSLLNFVITRDDISLFTVDTSYMLDNQTGYIKINRFGATTYEEFMNAMFQLQSKGMNRLVLDLRNNGGGYMQQAIMMLDEFFDEGKTIVSTRGRIPQMNSSYSSTENGIFKNQPLIVLVNEGSASASEIVSGAVQDWDRGLVVGSRTFGKGHVMLQYPLPDSSSIILTTSKYYTPSGRLIQKPYANGREEYAYELIKRERDPSTDAVRFIQNVPDSLVYKTNSGRLVYAGGGIVPDHIIQGDTTGSFTLGFMRRKRISTEFVMDHLARKGDDYRNNWKNRFEEYRTNFSWDQADKDAFKKRITSSGLFFTDTTATPRFTMTGDTLYINPKTYEKEMWVVEGALKAELAQQIFGSSQYYIVWNDIFDLTLKETMKLWPEVSNLQTNARRNTTQKGVLRNKP
jgi:carboxyl-terminal processing protease